MPDEEKSGPFASLDEYKNVCGIARLYNITLSMCISFAAVTRSVPEILNPTTGALVHNAGSCPVVLITALLYDRKFE